MTFYQNKSNRDTISSSFTKDPICDFSTYSKGYRLAAHNLSKIFISSQFHLPDYEGYPIVFLYRHSFELALKHVVLRSQRLINDGRGINDRAELIKAGNHNLNALAVEAARLLKQCFPNECKDTEITKKIVQTAHDFSKLDPHSYSYRYPVNKVGAASTKRNQIINIKAMSEHMDVLLSELELINDSINANIDILPDNDYE